MEKDNSTLSLEPDEKVCFNCKYMLWLVGLGLGLKCNLDKSKIPNRYHTCSKFDFKTENN
jgi:hypothetical protein